MRGQAAPELPGRFRVFTAFAALARAPAAAATLTAVWAAALEAGLYRPREDTDGVPASCAIRLAV